MSKIKFTSNTAGTATFNVVSPATNTNRVHTLPDNDGTILTSGDIASTVEAQGGTSNTRVMTPVRVKESLNASGSAPTYACRAWVYFNGDTGTIVAQGNVQSVTRVSAGLYTINFTTAMPDTNYAVIGQTGLQINNYMTSVMTVSRSTTSVQVDVKSTNHARYDAPDMSIAIFR